MVGGEEVEDVATGGNANGNEAVSDDVILSDAVGSCCWCSDGRMSEGCSNSFERLWAVLMPNTLGVAESGGLKWLLREMVTEREYVDISFLQIAGLFTVQKGADEQLTQRWKSR